MLECLFQLLSRKTIPLKVFTVSVKCTRIDIWQSWVQWVQGDWLLGWSGQQLSTANTHFIKRRKTMHCSLVLQNNINSYSISHYSHIQRSILCTLNYTFDNECRQLGSLWPRHSVHVHNSTTFSQNGLTLSPTRISNCIYYEVWYKVAHPILNSNGGITTSNFIAQFTWHVISYPCWS